MHILTGMLLGEMLLGSAALKKFRRGGPAYEMVHVLPGRLRLRVERIKEDDALRQQLCDALAAVKGVTSVAADPRTGSLLLLFSDGTPTRQAIVATLDRLTAEPEADDRAAPEEADDNTPLLRRKVKGLGRALNRGVMEESHGVADLSTLSAVAAMVWGGKIVLWPGAESRWRGATLIYWSYNMLRRG